MAQALLPARGAKRRSPSDKPVFGSSGRGDHESHIGTVKPQLANQRVMSARVGLRSFQGDGGV